MPTIDPEQARRFAVDVVRALRAAGHEAYWAGGCVRDRLLGLTPKDYDVATSATPAEVQRVFARRRTLAIGAAFGVISVLGPRGAGAIEVATFREDAGYSDGRRPDAVTFSTARHDAQRRDFTINGLFFDPLAEQVIDFVDGQRDLRDGVVRAIGDPEKRFDEDKLRLLRAARFAAAFGFEIEPATLAAIRRRAAELRVVSAERVAGELRRMLTSPRRGRALRLLRDTGLLAVVLPGCAAVFARDEAAWLRAVALLERLPDPTFPPALAATLRAWTRAEKLDPGEIRARVADVGRRLKLAAEETRLAAFVLAHEALARDADALPWPRVQRVLIQPEAGDLVEFADAAAAADEGPRGGVALCRRKRALPESELNPPPLLTGDDLRALGRVPGPRFKTLLDEARDAQLEGRLRTKEEALEFAKTRE